MLFLLSGFPDGCFLFCFSLFRFVSLLSKMQILLPRSKSTTDMPFRLILIQHLPCLPRQCRIDLQQTLRDVLMYGRHNLERFHFLQLIQIHLTQDHQASVNKYLHFPPYLLLSSESIVLTADWSSGVHL